MRGQKGKPAVLERIMHTDRYGTRRPQIAGSRDYLPIIIRSDNRDEALSRMFINEDDVQVAFSRLFPLRVCTMHGREISKEHFVLLLVELRRILRAIEAVGNGISEGDPAE